MTLIGSYSKNSSQNYNSKTKLASYRLCMVVDFFYMHCIIGQIIAHFITSNSKGIVFNWIYIISLFLRMFYNYSSLHLVFLCKLYSFLNEQHQSHFIMSLQLVFLCRAMFYSFLNEQRQLYFRMFYNYSSLQLVFLCKVEFGSFLNEQRQF